VTSGRISDYNLEFVEQAKKLAKLGATDADVADFFEVDVRTIYRWKIEHPLFCQALKSGKAQADRNVEKSLYLRAMGYAHDTTEIFCYEGEPVRVDVIKQYPPDTTACIFWLKNRKPEQWRDKQEQEHTGSVTVNIVDFTTLPDE